MISTLTAAQQWQDLASGNITETVLPARPFQLVTLWDMLRFYAGWLYRRFIPVNRAMCIALRAIDQRGKDSPCLLVELQAIRDDLPDMLKEAENLGLKRTKEHIEDLWMSVDFHLHYPSSTLSLAELQSQLSTLRTKIARDLDDQVFMVLRNSETGYYEQEQLFGPDVFANFSGTRNDVAEAGNCYATGRYTACVFHCMRVIEKGLHALVRDLNNRFGANVVFNRDIEYVNWGNIIDKLESEIRGLLQPSRQPRLAPDDLQFYSQTATEFVYLKNAWRDDVSHSRSSYDENEAKSVMNHVEAFMRQLAKRLTE